MILRKMIKISILALGLFCVTNTGYSQGLQIESINPDHAVPSDTEITVTVTIGPNGAPPGNVLPTSLTIGDIEGINLIRNSLDISAVFDFPGDIADGLYDVTLNFPSPNGELSFQKTSGFSIGDIEIVEESFFPLEISRPGSYLGYTLFSPMGQPEIYLIDMNGQTAHTWVSQYSSGLSADYLLADGSLLRTIGLNRNDSPETFADSSGGGRIEWLNPDSSLRWEYEHASESTLSHHDLEWLPNGNILFIAWEVKTEEDAIAAGRNPSLVTGDGIWMDAVYEIQPSGESGGTIVWEWHLWDHLVQDRDGTRENYGVIANHPEKVNFNFTSNSKADWTHVNSIDYNAERDEILLSVRNLSEIWIIDHDTTSVEAAGPAGDLRYRWGNFQAYGAGTGAGQQLFLQHDARWIENGYPGTGNIMIFNNGQGRPDGNYSSVVEITPPLDQWGMYDLIQGSAWEPSIPTWTYTAETPEDFYSDRISGAHRLPNGNTMICEGTSGRLFEITANKEIVWQYQNLNSSAAPDGGNSSVFRASRIPWDHPGLSVLGLDFPESDLPYTIVDTNQHYCADNSQMTVFPTEGNPFYGQDAQYDGYAPRYRDNGDGTISDLNTGLMWQQNLDPNGKVTFADAVNDAEAFDLAGYDDWRMPTIKELYSLVDFRGSSFETIPYIDISYFEFKWGDESAGERAIDAQFWSSAEYVGYTYGDDETVFGVNFADGRIKGYPKYQPSSGNTKEGSTMYVRYVRGNPDYGKNDFTDNGDGTITGLAAGLMWQKGDSGRTLNWQEALAYAENLELAGYDDWRMPNAKELQSLVDYTRAPEALDPDKQSAAIDPIFDLTETESWFWSNTNFHENQDYSNAVYVTFGRATGIYDGAAIDVHGAGAQRGDPKSGNPEDFPDGHGPQNDEIRIYNYVRAVRPVNDDSTAIPHWDLYE